jgi:hypothetical protein
MTPLTTQDLVVDWSLLRPRQRLLRPDLAYGWPGFYYFAMTTNILVRFVYIWCVYVISVPWYVF